jgi:hypothetical protein
MRGGGRWRQPTGSLGATNRGGHEVHSSECRMERFGHDVLLTLLPQPVTLKSRVSHRIALERRVCM